MKPCRSIRFDLSPTLLVWIMLAMQACVPTQNQVQRRRPNIILVMTDQQSIDAMSAGGNPYLKTPAMDRLAAEGVRFTQSYTTSPVCGPARSSILTGLMPHETGVEWNGDRINEEVLNAGQIFRGAGYYTAWAGKWHLPESYPLRSGSNQREIRGFDLVPFYDPEAPSWLLGTDTDPPLTLAVVEFLESYDRTEPFFLGVSYHNPHDICLYPRKPGWEVDADSMMDVPPFGRLKLDRSIVTHPRDLDVLPPLPANFEISSSQPEFERIKRTLPSYGNELLLASGYSELEWRAYLYSYYRLTELVDKEIGQVLEAVDAAGLSENTLIVFTSDHGDGMAAHKWAAKLSLYEEAAKVPLIFHQQGAIPGGEIRDELVSGIDILPTLCDFAGIDYTSFTGASLRSVIENANVPWRDYVVTELSDYRPEPTRKGRMVRSSRFKYNVFSKGEGNEQFFDLGLDSGEMQNLAYESALQDQVERHREWLEEWQQATRDSVRFFGR